MVAATRKASAPSTVGHERQGTKPRVIRRCGKGGSCSCGCQKLEEAGSVIRRRPSSLPLIPEGDATALGTDQERSVKTALSAPGSAFDSRLLRDVEGRTGRDVSYARLIKGSAADAACDAISAQAFTVGDQVVLGRTEGGGDSLATTLRHELVHVAQSHGSPPTGPLRLGSDSAPAEHQARHLSTGPSRPAKAAPASGHAAGRSRGVVRRKPQAKATGSLLFVTVDPDANTVTFVTTAGSLVYDLAAPTSLQAGGYRFGVTVSGNNVTLNPPTDMAGGGGGTFSWKIKPDQPNPATLLRGTKTVSVIVAASQAPTGGAGQEASDPTAATMTDVHVSVKKMTPDQFTAMTGASPDVLPEGQIVPLDQVVATGGSSRADQDRFPSIPFGPAGVGAWSATPTPMSFVPKNSTGIMWTDGHLSVFSNLETGLTVRGYRGNLAWYLGPFGEKLNTGVPGGFKNDWLFPRMGGPLTNIGANPQSVVYLPTDRDTAQSFADELNATEYGGDYRYSPPRTSAAGGSPREAGLNQRLYGGDPTAVRCGNNCITVPISQVEQAIGSRPQVQVGDQTLDIASGNLQPSGEYSIYDQGRASRMREFMANPQGLAPGASSIRYTPGAMRGMGAIRVGGTIALVYGVYKTQEHLREAYGTPDFPEAVGQEAGGWAGGILGSALGGATGAAIACLPAGPVDAICIVGGFLGGLLFGALFGTAGAAGGGLIGRNWDDVSTALETSVFPLNASMLEKMSEADARKRLEDLRKQDPDATPADLDRLDQVQQQFDDWGRP
jgi:hypothetical protein